MALEWLPISDKAEQANQSLKWSSVKFSNYFLPFRASVSRVTVFSVSEATKYLLWVILMSFPHAAWEQVKFKKKMAQTLSVAQASSGFPRLTQRLRVP